MNMGEDFQTAVRQESRVRGTGGYPSRTIESRMTSVSLNSPVDAAENTVTRPMEDSSVHGRQGVGAEHMRPVLPRSR